MSSTTQAGGPIWYNMPGKPGSGKQVVTTFQYSTDNGATWNYAPADPRSITLHRGDGKKVKAPDDGSVPSWAVPKNSLVESLIALMGSGHATYATGLDRPYIPIINRQDRWPTSLAADRTMSALKRHCVTDQLEVYDVPIDLPVQYVRRQTLDGQETKLRFLLTGALQAATEGSTPPPNDTPVSVLATVVASGSSGRQTTTGTWTSKTVPHSDRDHSAIPKLEVTCAFRVRGDDPSDQADWIPLRYCPAETSVESVTNLGSNEAPREYPRPTGKAWLSSLAPVYDRSLISSDGVKLSKEAQKRKQLAKSAFHNGMKNLPANADHWDFRKKGDLVHVFTTRVLGGQPVECRITLHDPSSADPDTSSHANYHRNQTSLVAPETNLTARELAKAGYGSNAFRWRAG